MLENNQEESLTQEAIIVHCPMSYADNMLSTASRSAIVVLLDLRNPNFGADDILLVFRMIDNCMEKILSRKHLNTGVFHRWLGKKPTQRNMIKIIVEVKGVKRRKAKRG
ncbi:hypothetical protein EVAR_45752_1 [Eumeta japonica]|uniref:Uncharacterized protein n=1 Tax=Eumeta variegata TaxID=151549 RepID=A0A4C1YT76_EUMVA|nr:hypothetical protein EVAR_45752_1 [Eumeta japonica]